jgi:hypothetical protein
MPDPRIYFPILVCFAMAACTWNPFAPPQKQPAKHQSTGNPVHNGVSAKKSPTPGQKVAPPVITAAVTPSVVNKPQDVQAVGKAAGDTLRQLTKDQAQNALKELKPGSPVTDNPQEEITGMLIDATTMDQVLQILKVLQQAKQE